jgi:hypothetical protein
MCCFSGRIEKVSDTNIYARASKEGKQFLVYSMFLSAKAELSMILPIPTPKKSKEDAVRFINLKGYPDFFADMLKGFPTREPDQSNSGSDSGGGSDEPKKLEVVTVGSFEASFVPEVKDFSRLDERFRLPTKTWNELPAYKDYGFVVFKLKKGKAKVHPMAFEFPRAEKKKLFFPTVHIHDGKVHKTASFDHALYCQTSGEDTTSWKESPQPAGFFLKIAKTAGMVEKNNHVYQRLIKGKKKNEDVWLA